MGSAGSKWWIHFLFSCLGDMPVDLRAPVFFLGQAGRLRGSVAQPAKDEMIRKSPRCGPGCAELLRKGGEGMNQVIRVLRLPQELVAFLGGSWAACSAPTMGGGLRTEPSVKSTGTKPRTSIDHQPAVTHGHEGLSPRPRVQVRHQEALSFSIDNSGCGSESPGARENRGPGAPPATFPI